MTRKASLLVLAIVSAFVGKPATGESLVVHKQARGFAMLALMHPKARSTANAQIETLVRSKLKNVYLSVLVDGTFSVDYPFLNSAIRRLNQNGRSLTLAIYLTNGPTQRRYKYTPIKAGFNQINPVEFRTLIKEDQAIREHFIDIARSARPSFELNSALGASSKNIAIVMLEDNLRSDSYAEMRLLARRVLPDNVQFIRNPCPGCFPGNDSNSMGDPVEVHQLHEYSGLSGKDGMTMDGVGYRLGESDSVNKMSFEESLQLMRSLSTRGPGYVGLWRAERQGLGPNGQIHPNDRLFEVPSNSQRLKEIQLLTAGIKSKKRPAKKKKPTSKKTKPTPPKAVPPTPKVTPTPPKPVRPSGNGIIWF